MIPDSIIVRCGEMFLKGGNLPYFENRLIQNTRAITGISAITKLRGRLLLPYFSHHSSLCRVFGISSYSPALKTEKTIEGIQKTALTLLSRKPGTFKIETRRSDKRFPLTSPQINKEVGQYIEANTKWKFDFANPTVMIYLEINNRGAYLYTEIMAGAGGLPVGTAGKINVRIETEADILAGLLMMKRGCTILPLCIGEENNSALLQCTEFSTRSMAGGVQQRTHTGSGENSGTRRTSVSFCAEKLGFSCTPKEPPQAKLASHRSLTSGGRFLFEKFSAQEMKKTFFKNKVELNQYIQENNIPFVVTGENFETKKESPAGVIVFKPLIAYTQKRINEDIERFTQVG